MAIFNVSVTNSVGVGTLPDGQTPTVASPVAVGQRAIGILPKVKSGLVVDHVIDANIKPGILSNNTVGIGQTIKASILPSQRRQELGVGQTISTVGSILANPEVVVQGVIPGQTITTNAVFNRIKAQSLGVGSSSIGYKTNVRFDYSPWN